MEIRFTLFSILFLTTTMVSFFGALLAWQRRHIKSALELAWLLATAGFWTFWIMFETSALTTELKILWSQIAYIGAVSTPVLYFIFVFRFIGKEKYLKPKNLIALFIIPAITLVMAFTNHWHQLLWSGYSPISAETNLMEYYHGLAFWFGYMAYNYLLLMIVTLNLFDFIINQTIQYRKQGIIIAIAGLCPWTASILYLSGSNPVPGLDIGPVSMILSGILFTYAIFYFRFLDLIPVARRTLVEILPEGILAIDDRNRIQEINQAAYQFLGLSKKDVIDNTLDELAEKSVFITKILAQSTIDRFELTDQNKTYSIIQQPILNQEGSRLIILRDITEQIETQQKIRVVDDNFKSMSRMFRLMADNMPDLLWAKDLDKNYVFANKAMCNSLLQAKDTDEPVGKNDLYFASRERLNHPDDPLWHTFGELCQDTDDVVIQQAKASQFDESGYVTGKFLFLDVNKAPILDEEGRMIGVVGSGRDITLQKKNEAEISRKDKLLDAIARATALLIQGDDHEQSISSALKIIGLATKADRAYLFQNTDHPEYKLPLMSQIFEWTNEHTEPQIDNTDLQNLPYELAAPRWYEILSRGEAVSGVISEFPEPERSMLQAQGIQTILATPIFIDRHFWGFIGFDDCSNGREWPLVEQRILATAANTIGAAYLRKKNREDLIAAKVKAEESDRLKSAFLANMSHEIRTPMNGILGFAELLKEPGLSGAEQQEYISIIEKSGLRMLNIINDIVDISKIESGQMDVNIKELDINTLIQYIHAFFSPDAEAKKISFSYHNLLSSADSLILSDREKLYSILTNLVKNAIKYTSKGSIEMGYTLKGDQIEFFVSDTGMGIPLDRQQAVFERFVQADIADKMAMQGAGLGLSISKAYVEMLKGKIGLQSEVNTGSTFWFTIPYLKPDQPSLMEEVKIPYHTKNEKLLKFIIAEDENINNKYISLALEAVCETILYTENGIDTVQLMKEYPDIDVILMDLKMPVMDGIEATKQIRGFNNKVIIIAQTAFVAGHDRENALQAGCNDYVTKPVRIRELMQVIKKHLPQS